MDGRFYLIGHPLGHSFSPSLHRLFGNDRYSLKDLEEDEVGPFLKSREFDGLNVTIPYKRTVIPYLAELSPRAEAIGAVNTVKKQPDGSLYGDNTDAAGFLALADRAGVSFAGRHVVVLGSGGASRTAVWAAKSRGAASVTVVSRSGPVDYGVLYSLTDTEVLVNATPVGMYPSEDAMPADPARFPALKGALDLVYNPLRTLFVQAARSLGVPAAGGLYMLAAQGSAANAVFTDREEDTGELERVFSALTRQKENLVLCGMPGSGKSTIGKMLAEKLSMPYIDTDEKIVEKAGMPIPEIFSRRGEKAFRDLEADVIREAARRSGQVISTGGGAVLREENRLRMRMNGRVFLIRRPAEALATAGRPLSRDLAALRAMEKERAPLYALAADAAMDNLTSPDDAVRAILEDLKCVSL